MSTRRVKRNTYSRGLGRIERILLAALEQSPKPIDTFDLAVKAYGLNADDDGVNYVSETQFVSVRRALRSLERADKIFNISRGHNTRAHLGNRATFEKWHAKGIGLSRRPR